VVLHDRLPIGLELMTEEAQMLIQKLRLQHGWSQEQLAELSGLSVRTIQRLERGQTASTESLKALASVFQVDFSILKEPQMETSTNAGVSADEALALAHVRKIKGLYIHLIQYIAIVGFLAIVNFLTYPRHLWVVWVAVAWGLGVLLHALRVFERIPFLTGDWERRQVERYLGRKL
jgi:transcriptional regulator with XRE-family HTH domain